MRSPLVPIRPAERRSTLGAFLTLWGIMMGHALLETARDSLFLARLAPSELPWVYLGIAFTALTASRVQQRWHGEREGRATLGTTLVVAAAVTFGFWLLLPRVGSWSLYALYIWSGLIATLAITRFWTLVEDVFTVTQAKRLFALVGAGSVLGAISGSALARLLAALFVPESLLIAAAVVLALSGLSPLLLLRRADDPSAAPAEDLPGAALNPPLRCPDPLDWGHCLRMMMAQPYVKRVLLLALISTGVFTLVDYVFKSVVAQHVPAYALASFFSSTYLGLNVLSLVVQLGVVGLLMRTVALHRILATPPALLAIGSAALLVVLFTGPAAVILPALALKGIDGALRHSLHRTAMETLFVPMSKEMRSQVKAFIDVMGQRGGQAIVSVLILAVVPLPRPLLVLTVLVLLFAGAWMLVARSLHTHYLDVFRDTLREGRFETRIDFPELDLASLETLIATLNSPNDLEVRAALDLLAEQGRTHLIPALILYHPSREVVIQALGLFADAGREDFLALVPRLQAHEDEEIRAAALRASSAVRPDVTVQMNEFLDDESPVVRATALAGLVAAEWLEGEPARKALSGLTKDATLEERLALAHAIQQQPHESFVPLLLENARSEDPGLRLEVARAMRAVAHPAFVPEWIHMLGRRALRTVARPALVELGRPALEALDAALEDPSTPLDVLRHIPRTIHRFEPRAAAPLLLRHLAKAPDGLVRYKILRGLGALRAKDPTLPLDDALLADATEKTLAGCFRMLDWRMRLERGAAERPERRTPVHELLVTMLRHKESHAVERLFRLLGLLYPSEDFEHIHQGLSSARPQAVASSRELVEAILPSPLREAVLGLVDDLPDAGRLRYAGGYYAAHERGYEAILEEFLEQNSLAMRCLAVYHVGELGLEELRPRLEALPPEPSGFLADVVARALDLLRSPDAERLQLE